MSVIVKNLSTNQIILLSKGADSIIKALLKDDQNANLDTVMRFVNEYACDGLKDTIIGSEESHIEESFIELGRRSFILLLLQS